MTKNVKPYVILNSFESYFPIKEKSANGHDGEMSITFPAEFDVEISVFDSQANPLVNAEVIVMRGEANESHGFTDENGKIVFTLPPAHYD